MKKQKVRRNQSNRSQRRAKRKTVVAARKTGQSAAPISLINQARTVASKFGVNYSVVTDGIFELGIGYVVLGRTISSAKVATGVFLVDMHCLGVKNAFYVEYTHDELQKLISKLGGDESSVVDIAPECARKIVEGALAYAKELGFTPHTDYPPAGALFGNIDAGACPEEYEFGKDGKPFYVSGPNDTPAMIRKVVRTLTTTVGEGNFDFILDAGGL